jgi:hypothetical protein
MVELPPTTATLLALMTSREIVYTQETQHRSDNYPHRQKVVGEAEPKE